MSKHDDAPHKKAEKPGPLAVIGSVASAAFGVRSSRFRGRENSVKFHHYVIAAIGFVVVFLLVVNGVVRLVLSQTGSA